MTAEQEYLLQVLRAAVRGETVQTVPDGLDMRAFTKEAEEQTVWLAAYDTLAPVLKEMDIDPDAAELAAVSVLSANVRVEQTQAEVVGVLNEVGSPYVILKGLTSCAWYPKPEIRLLGDVDFLVPGEYEQAVIEKMRTLGYTDIYYPGAHHVNLDKGDMQTELHRQIAGVPEEKGRAEILAYLDSIYDRRTLLSGQFGDFYAPGEGHQALIQLLHLEEHITSGGVGLRHIMDWACFVDRNGEKPFWQEELIPLMKRVGLFRFMAAVTKLSAIYLGCVCPAWAEDIPEELCRDLMEDVLTGGNFSCKDTRRNQCFSLLPDWEGRDADGGKLRRLYNSLRRVILNQKPHLEGKPVAIFFAMAWKAVRYCALCLAGKRPDLNEVAELAQERESMYTRLKLFQAEEE